MQLSSETIIPLSTQKGNQEQKFIVVIEYLTDFN